jgi:hypothetical protein
MALRRPPTESWSSNALRILEQTPCRSCEAVLFSIHSGGVIYVEWVVRASISKAVKKCLKK